MEAILELPRGFVVLGGTLQFLGAFKREQEGQPPFRLPRGSGPSGAEDLCEVATPLGEPHLHGSQNLKIAGRRESNPRLLGQVRRHASPVWVCPVDIRCLIQALHENGWLSVPGY